MSLEVCLSSPHRLKIEVIVINVTRQIQISMCLNDSSFSDIYIHIYIYIKPCAMDFTSHNQLFSGICGEDVSVRSIGPLQRLNSE